MKKIHVLLSGGSGSRLWPLSTKAVPKQYIPIFGNKSLLQLAALKNQGVCDSLLLIGNVGNEELADASLKDINITGYSKLMETVGRNTAAAIAFAAFSAGREDLLLVTPSDHIIEDDILYYSAVERAFALAADNYLVTFGIKPNKPETGYGYIKHSGENVLSFHEKPDLSTAENFIQSGDYLWNSGIFCFKAGVYLDELKKYRPDIYEASLKCVESQSDNCLPREESLDIPSESIDYAVMEKSDKIKVVEGNFRWSDLGSYESLYDYFNGSTENSYINNQNLIIADGLHVEIIGLTDIVVVKNNNSLLILPKKDSQEVKKVYTNLEKLLPDLI